MEKKILHYDVNWSINNIADSALPYDMDIEMYNALHSFVLNTEEANKARAFDYLHKILKADFYLDRDYEAFMDIFASDNNIIAYAGVVECYDDEYLVVAFAPDWSMSFNVYAFTTWNEGDAFEVFKYDEGEE